MKLPKSHPFIRAVLQAEKLEREAGKVTDEVLSLRKEIKEKYPEYFSVYLKAKQTKQQLLRKTPAKTPRWLSQHTTQFAKPFVSTPKSEHLKRLLKKKRLV